MPISGDWADFRRLGLHFQWPVCGNWWVASARAPFHGAMVESIAFRDGGKITEPCPLANGTLRTMTTTGEADERTGTPQHEKVGLGGGEDRLEIEITAVDACP